MHQAHMPDQLQSHIPSVTAALASPHAQGSATASEAQHQIQNASVAPTPPLDASMSNLPPAPAQSHIDSTAPVAATAVAATAAVGADPAAADEASEQPRSADTSNQSDFDYDGADFPDDEYSYAYFSDRRHESMPAVVSAPLGAKAGHPTQPASNTHTQARTTQIQQDWRMRERLKTVSVSLVLCLNIGVDPPDVIKPNPCARMECWIDPFSLPAQKALEAVGRNLQQQYEVWQPRARYRLSLDPSIEETKKLCCSLRRNAKDERILFHYNGHGVPKPTPGGEIWVFNKNYTQYIPVSIYDIQTWLGSPCIFVYDCSNAGNILVAFDKFAQQRDAEMMRQHPELVRGSQAAEAAAAAAALTAAMATTSLSTTNATAAAANHDGATTTTHAGAAATAAVSAAPPGATATGNQDDAQTAAIQAAAASNTNNPQTDALASSTTLSQSNLTASMPMYTPMRECIQLAACQPHELLPTSPDLPADLFTCCLTTPIETALRWFVLQNDLNRRVTPAMIMKIPGKLADRRTPLGELNWIFTAITDTIAWNVLPSPMFQKLFRQDLMVAALFRNFLLADRIMRFYKCHPMSSPVLPETHRHSMWDAWDLAADQCLRQLPALLESEAAVAASAAAAAAGAPATNSADPMASLPKRVEYRFSTFFTEQLTAFEVWLRSGPASRKPPQQLPIVLQVLLSQVHRLRALMLLSKFLDLGEWAVSLALSVGIFPYVLRLLQSPASELKPVLVFIWAKIIAVDPSCQNDLVKDNGYTYFVNILSTENSNMPAISNLSEHRAMCAFILSVFCHAFRFGQQACLKTDLLQALIPHLEDKDPLLRQWSCVCLTELCRGFADAKWLAMSRGVHEGLATMLADPVAEVRAAAVATLGTLFGDLEKTPQAVQVEQRIATLALRAYTDASPLVRQELVVALSRFVCAYIDAFTMVALELIHEERKQTAVTLDERRLSDGRGVGTVNGRNNAVDMLLRGGPYQDSLHMTIYKAVLNLSVDPAPNVAALATHVVDRVHLRLFLSQSLAKTHTVQALLASHPDTFLSTGLPSSLTTTSTPMGGANVASQAVMVQPVVRGPLQPPMSNTSGASNGVDAGAQPHSGNLPLSRQASSSRSKQALLPGQFQSRSTGSSSAVSPRTSTSPNSQAIRRSSSLVSSLRSLAGLIVGSYGAHQNDVAQPLHGHAAGHAGPVGHHHPHAHQKTHYPSGLHAPGGVTRRPGSSLARQQRPLSVPSFVRNVEDGRYLEEQAAIAAATSSSPHIHRDPHPQKAPTMSSSPISSPHDHVSPRSVNSTTTPGISHEQVIQHMTEEIALTSTFYEWSCAYFSEPQMRVPEVDDPGSVKHTERLWRRERNQRVQEETDALYAYASMAHFDEYVASAVVMASHAGASFSMVSSTATVSGVTGLNTGVMHRDRATPRMLLFHAYEPTLVVSDDRVVTVYDWETMTRTNAFLNDAVHSSRITTMQLINEDDVALLLTGSDDGLLRLYRGYDQPGGVELVSAWRGISDLLPGSRRSRVVCRWQQSSGYLFTGGDSCTIRVWDAEEELCVQELATKSISPVTDIAVDAAGTMLLSGYADGNVHMYDRRLPPRESMVMSFGETHSRVLQLSYLGHQRQEFLMGTVDGNVLLWDIRQQRRTLKLNSGIGSHGRLDIGVGNNQHSNMGSGSYFSYNTSGSNVGSHAHAQAAMATEMQGFSIHERAQLVACAATTHQIRVMSLAGETLGTIRCSDTGAPLASASSTASTLTGGFLLSRPTTPSAVHALAFHPRRLVLGVAAASGAVSVFRSELKSPPAAPFAASSALAASAAQL